MKPIKQWPTWKGFKGIYSYMTAGRSFTGYTVLPFISIVYIYMLMYLYLWHHVWRFYGCCRNTDPYLNLHFEILPLNLIWSHTYILVFKSHEFWFYFYFVCCTYLTSIIHHFVWIISEISLHFLRKKNKKNTYSNVVPDGLNIKTSKSQ